MQVNATLAKFAPIGASVLMEYASVAQLWRMWHVRSALGQNPWSWLAVLAALLLYYWHYVVCAPDLKLTRWACGLSAAVVTVVFGTVLYFQ